MATIIPATKARNNFFDILDSVFYEGKEFVVEKNGESFARIVPEKKRPTPEEVDKILAEVRSVFGTKKQKYWGVMDTPEWKRREKRSFKELYKKAERIDAVLKAKIK